MRMHERHHTSHPSSRGTLGAMPKRKRLQITRLFFHSRIDETPMAPHLTRAKGPPRQGKATVSDPDCGSANFETVGAIEPWPTTNARGPKCAGMPSESRMAALLLAALVAGALTAVPINTKTMKNFGHSIKNGQAAHTHHFVGT
jgi:hypothetical protein